MIHPDTKHHEEISALPFALAMTAILWPWLKAYLARKDKTETKTQERKDQTP